MVVRVVVQVVGRTRLPLLVALMAVLPVGCGHMYQAVQPSTSLTMVAKNPTAGTATFHLRCHPAGGDIKHAARVCAALAAHSNVLLHPKPFVCAGGMTSWWDITITGRFAGKPVSIVLSTCWTRQMALIDRLGLGFAQLESHTVPPIKGGLDTSTLPQSSLAVVIDIPARTPTWLIDLARKQARWLQDPRPEKMRIRLGKIDVIELWGRFVCGKCYQPPGGGPPRGTHARITVDSRTRDVISLALDS